MGFFKKLFGTAAVTTAAIGGALYVKKRKEENVSENDFEDFDDQSIFEVNTEDANDGKSKVTITFNSKKAKQVADKAADKVIDATDKVKETMNDKLGEEKVSSIKEKMDTVGDYVSQAADTASVKAKEAKDIVVDKIGEENIQAAKDKVIDVTDVAKEKISDVMSQVVKTTSTKNDDDFVDEDAAKDAEIEDDVTTDDSDILDDELEDL